MASVFLRGDFWFASFRVWDAKRRAWRWVTKGTHLKDKGAALAVAVGLERASGDAKAGTMTREKAEALVNDIMRWAGLDVVAAVPGLWEFSKGFWMAPGLAVKSAGKYRGIWDRFVKWAGKDRPLDTWTGKEFGEYYAVLAGELSAGTANDHLRFWRSVYNKAVRLGLVRGNPVAGVDLVARAASSKVPIDRGDQVLLLRWLRVSGLVDWITLALLGWHTGHRVQDLLALGKGSVARAGGRWVLEFQPAKKQGAGGRLVRLPVPAWLGKRVARLDGAGSLRVRPNANGHVSNEFVEHLRAAGVDPLPVQLKSRVLHLKSFHSYRHAMSSRLAAAGVHGAVARLVTDHTSEAVHAGYVHAEVEALETALRAARRK